VQADGRGLVPSSTYTYSVQRCVQTFPYFKQHILFALDEEDDYLYSARATGRTCNLFLQFVVRWTTGRTQSFDKGKSFEQRSIP